MGEPDQGLHAWGIRCGVERGGASSLRLDDRGVVGDEYWLQPRKGSAYPRRVLLVPHSVRRDHDPAETRFPDGFRRTAAHLERFNGGLDDDHDDVDRVVPEA
ncbi:hypothetical protein SAMN05661080_03884 [Modestobacter sp. DSM 44400]|nr:hypothetical protein SAMN05661080_03884 [Modestobacter sp. DSM 44400]